MRGKLTFLFFLGAMQIYGGPISTNKIYLDEPNSPEAVAPLLPKRVYWVFEQKINDWMRVISDEGGNLANPPEPILVGTVVPASYLGDGTRDRNFEFSEKGTWVATKKEIHFFHTRLSDPPHYFEVSYLPLNADQPAIKAAK